MDILIAISSIVWFDEIRGGKVGVVVVFGTLYYILFSFFVVAIF
jgi:hypothetical protein